MWDLLAIWIITAFTLYVGLFWVLMAIENRNVLRTSCKPTRWPSISILVPAYNEERAISSCVHSLLSVNYPKKPQIIVINDGSTDGTARVVAAIASKHDNVKLITQPNRGKGAALNAGIAFARGELVAVVDADSSVSRSALNEMVGHFDDGKVGAVVASIKPYKPRRFLTRLQSAEYVISCLYRRLGSLTNTMYVTPGALSVFRSRVVRELGGFDEHNLTEDMEIALRMQKNGWEIRNSMTAISYTQLPETLKALYHQRVRWYRGLLTNTWKYKGMLFNRRYGLLGLWQLPMNIIFPFVSILVIAMFAWFAGLTLYRTFLELLIVGPTTWAFSLERFLLGFDWRVMVPWIMGLAFGVSVLLLSYREVQEKITKYTGRLSALVFLMVFYTIINVLWCFALAKNIIRSERKW